MNLLDIRKQFIRESGRYDLVVDTVTYADNGADFHITSGQKYLDKLAQVPENTAQLFLPLGLGEYSLSFQNHCRSIESVFINSTTDRWELEKKDLRELKSYFSEAVSVTDSGTPSVFAIANLRALETTSKTSLGTFINLTWEESDTKYDYRGLIITPPAAQDYVVEVTGRFAQNILSDDTDENWWSLEYPHILIMGAMRSLEIFNRNSEGRRDWEQAITMETFEIGKDVAHEESFDVDQMEG